MIEQVNNAITFYFYYTGSNGGVSGIADGTVNVRRGSTGALIITSGALTEIGDGFYKYTLAANNVSSEDDYIARSHTANATVDQKDLPAIWVINKAGVENLDATVATRATPAQVTTSVLDVASAGHVIAGSIGEKISNAGSAADPLNNTVPGVYASGTAGYVLGSLNGVTLTLTSPLTNSGDVTLYLGDDYYNTEARSLEWTEDGTSWPLDLTSAAISMTIRRILTNTEVSLTGSVITPTGTRKVRIEIPNTVTSALVEEDYTYRVRATMMNGHIITLAAGDLSVTRGE